MKETFHAAMLVIAGALSGCVVSRPDSYALSAEQAELNRQNTERIERIGRLQEQEERMSKADAAEVATRHAPTNVSTTQVYAPRF